MLYIWRLISRFLLDKMYPEAEPHFVAGNAESSKSYGEMLAEWSEKDQPSKKGAYIARAVLQYVIKMIYLHNQIFSNWII